jgi:hypothetical protein
MPFRFCRRRKGEKIARKRWTEEDDKKLKILLSQGLTYPEIAEKMGRTKQAVQLRALKLGIRRRKRWTAEEERKLREMFEQGMPFAAMCSQLNRSYAAILVRASKLGLKRGTRKGISKRMKSKEEIRKRIQELDTEIEEIKRTPPRI